MDYTQEDLPSYILLGHSFIRHAHRYICRHREWKNLEIQDAEVFFDGHVENEDDKILFIEDIERWMTKFHATAKFASIILIEISSNDLQEDFFKKTVKLADKVFDVAEQLRDLLSNVNL